MKATKTLTVLILILLFINLPSQLLGKSPGGGFLVVEVYESNDKGYSMIVVTENGNRLDEVPLKEFYYKNLVANQLEVSRVLGRYKSLGYRLVSSTKTDFNVGPSMLVSTYLFEKD